MSDMKRLGKILTAMIVVFTIAGFIAASVMVIGVIIYPPAPDLKIDLPANFRIEQFNTAEQIVNALTVSDFRDLLNKKEHAGFDHLLHPHGPGRFCPPGEKGRAFTAFLKAATEVMMKVIGYIMLYAPDRLMRIFLRT